MQARAQIVRRRGKRCGGTVRVANLAPVDGQRGEVLRCPRGLAARLAPGTRLAEARREVLDVREKRRVPTREAKRAGSGGQHTHTLLGNGCRSMSGRCRVDVGRAGVVEIRVFVF